MPDRLTGRTDDEIRSLFAEPASALTFNELLALAGYALSEKTDGLVTAMLPDAATTAALEDALTRYNSACYRRAGTWKRADPDRRESA